MSQTKFTIELRVVTVKPPIPTSNFDYLVHEEGKENGAQGWGPSVETALENFARAYQHTY